MKNKIKKFDKYDYYFRSVQDTDQVIQFTERIYRSNFHRPLKTLGEDFSGTFALSCAWVKKGRGRKAVAVDLGEEPLSYGRRHYLPRLKKEVQKNLVTINKNVIDKSLPKVNAIVALNYSFFILKDRKTLLAYFKNCKKRLSGGGLLVLDCFGGNGTLEANEESSRIQDFIYYWDQKNFNPITSEAKFSIHFKRKGEKKRQNVFTYDWRMWTLPELRDLLTEAGFIDISFYFEGTDKNGGGNGVFTKRTKEEDCEAWLAYVTARS